MKHDAALRALMGESKAQQKQRLQERLEQLRKLKQEGGEVDEGQMAALEQVEAEGVDAVDAEVLNQLIEETMTNTEEVTTSTLLNDLSVRLTFSSPIGLRLPPPLPPTTHLPITYFPPHLPLSLLFSLFLFVLPFSLFSWSHFHLSIPPFSSSFFSSLSPFSFPVNIPSLLCFIFLDSSPSFLVEMYPFFFWSL